MFWLDGSFSLLIPSFPPEKEKRRCGRRLFNGRKSNKTMYGRKPGHEKERIETTLMIAKRHKALQSIFPSPSILFSYPGRAARKLEHSFQTRNYIVLVIEPWNCWIVKDNTGPNVCVTKSILKENLAILLVFQALCLAFDLSASLAFSSRNSIAI